ncbi:MAG: hypothetical protein KA436_09995 [Oligoflexales bacterium]|nr:hypothetical protein [Oligoflexales bacterium]
MRKLVLPVLCLVALVSCKQKRVGDPVAAKGPDNSNKVGDPVAAKAPDNSNKVGDPVAAKAPDNSNKVGDPVAAKAPDNDLIGTWESGCQSTQSLGMGLADTSGAGKDTDNSGELMAAADLFTRMTQYSFISETFSANDFAFEIKMYSDEKCGSLGYQISAQGSYSTGLTLTEPAGARTMDMETSKTETTVRNKELVDALNTLKFCDKTDWELDKSKAEDCFFMGGHDYDIFKIEGNKLYTGDSKEPLDGKKPDSRPNTFSKDILTKK